MAISAAVRRLVRDRAENCCEYCGVSQAHIPFATFHVEHVIARQHGGGDTEENLCLACQWCNFFKGTNIASIENAALVQLFYPRIHIWSDHFMRHGAEVKALTAIGRVTVRLLKMNDDERRELRGELT